MCKENMVYMFMAKSKLCKTNTFFFKNKEHSAIQRRNTFYLFQLPEIGIMVSPKHFGQFCYFIQRKIEINDRYVIKIEKKCFAQFVL